MGRWMDGWMVLCRMVGYVSALASRWRNNDSSWGHDTSASVPLS